MEYNAVVSAALRYVFKWRAGTRARAFLAGTCEFHSPSEFLLLRRMFDSGSPPKFLASLVVRVARGTKGDEVCTVVPTLLLLPLSKWPENSMSFCEEVYFFSSWQGAPDTAENKSLCQNLGNCEFQMVQTRKFGSYTKFHILEGQVPRLFVSGASSSSLVLSYSALRCRGSLLPLRA